jgi:Ran GTPase-activating protein (RanGAP) involved in mRNA processing and transport
MQSLASNDSIEVMHINHNSLGDESAQELIETLKRNKKLRKINITHNAINIRFIDEIHSYLFRNEMIAIERIKPDFEREIESMKND